MDLAITIGIMLCILVGGALSAVQGSKLFTKDVPQPLKGQQSMQIGMAWMLAAIVGFWRGPSGLGAVALFLGLLTFVSGCMAVYRYGKDKARAERLAALAQDIKPNDVVLPEGPYTTGKSASKRRRKAARKAALDAAALASLPPESNA